MARVGFPGTLGYIFRTSCTKHRGMRRVVFRFARKCRDVQFSPRTNLGDFRASASLFADDSVHLWRMGIFHHGAGENIPPWNKIIRNLNVPRDSQKLVARPHRHLRPPQGHSALGFALFLACVLFLPGKRCFAASGKYVEGEINRGEKTRRAEYTCVLGRREKPLTDAASGENRTFFFGTDYQYIEL